MKHDFTQYLMYTPYFRLLILQAIKHNKQGPETKNQGIKIGNNLIGIFHDLVKGMLQARVKSEILGLPRPRYPGFSIA